MATLKGTSVSGALSVTGATTLSSTLSVASTSTFKNTVTLDFNSASDKYISIGGHKIRFIKDSSNNDLIVTGGKLRFSSDSSWDYNCWAGLYYDHANKAINLGIADGDVFAANNTQTNGHLYLKEISDIEIKSSGVDQYINFVKRNYGYKYQIDGHDDNLHLYVNNNGSNGWISALRIRRSDGHIGILREASSYALDVNGSIIARNEWLRSSGNTGWYNESYGGGWWMTDDEYVRVYNSKRVYNPNSSYYAFYTDGGFATTKTGGLFSIYRGGTWYNDIMYNHNNGNLSIDAPGDSLYLAYNRGNCYFGGGTYYINRSGYFNGTASYADSAGSAAPAFANSTWYIVGDDAYIGDHDQAGAFCVKGANGAPRIMLYNSDNSYNSTVWTTASLQINYSSGTLTIKT